MDREERLLAYMQDKLDAADRAAFEVEITADPALAAEVAALKAVRQEFDAETVAGARAAGWERLSAAIASQRPVATNDNRPYRLSLWQAAAAAVVAVLMWQVAAVPLLQEDPATYRTVTETVAGPGLQVIFAEDAPAGEIAAVLREVGGTVTDGPSALGIWRVSFSDAEGRDAAMAALSARTDIIESVFVE